MLPETLGPPALLPLKIGRIVVDPPILLAPMAGYTTMPFRGLCRRYHCGLVYTELVSAEGIARRDPRTLTYLESAHNEQPIGAHVYSGDPEAFAAAARVIEDMGCFALIDINCGCPVRKVVSKNAGVALMRDPERIRAIVQAVSQSVSLPVTVKTRLGIDRGLFNISEVAQAAEEGGASALTLHARFGSDRHSGPADLATLGRIKQERSIPIIGNGGITDPSSARAMIEQTRADGLMIGRAAIGNPWVFEEIHRALTGEPARAPTEEERLAIMVEHLRGLHELMTAKNTTRKQPKEDVEKLTCHNFRGHLGRYLYGRRGLHHLQRTLMHMESLNSVIDAVGAILKSEPGSGARSSGLDLP